MRKITFLLLFTSSLIWSQTVRVDVSELTNVMNVELLANFGGSFALYQATDEGGDLWSFDVSSSGDAQNEYIWFVTFMDASTSQEAMASKIGGTGVDNDIAVDEINAGRVNTDFFSFCNRIVVIGDPDPPTFYYNSFRQPGVTYPEIVLTAPTGSFYYVFYSVNGFSQFGGPGAIDNGDGTHTALVRPSVAFEYKWVIDDTGGNASTDTQENLLTCTDDDVQINTDNSSFANRIHAAGENEADEFNTCPPPLSRDEFSILDLKVFPNPTLNDWNIKTNGSVITSIQVFDVLGKRVTSLTPNSSSATIKTDNLLSGLYFARIQGESGTKSIKLIKE